MSTVSSIATSLRPPGGADNSLLIQGCLVQLGCLTSTVWLGSPKKNGGLHSSAAEAGGSLIKLIRLHLVKEGNLGNLFP
jgi:hypothetical protein